MRPVVHIGRCLLGERLRERGISQIDLALVVRMSESRISDYIHNRRNMSVPTLINISLALGCSPLDLYELIPIK
jgi:plasmid maintenance system antidote protein VapI